MTNERYVVIPVECPRCKTKQKVHVKATGISGMGEQTVRCIMCNDPFRVAVPDKIIRGPFPA